eukprot:jgi/Botrbrau1/18884/Bobra.177_2s0043.2
MIQCYHVMRERFLVGDLPHAGAAVGCWRSLGYPTSAVDAVARGRSSGTRCTAGTQGGTLTGGPRMNRSYVRRGTGKRCHGRARATEAHGDQAGRMEAAEKLMDALERALTVEQQEELLRQLSKAEALDKLGPEALMDALSRVQETVTRGSPETRRSASGRARKTAVSPPVTGMRGPQVPPVGAGSPGGPTPTDLDSPVETQQAGLRREPDRTHASTLKDSRQQTGSSGETSLDAPGLSKGQNEGAAEQTEENERQPNQWRAGQPTASLAADVAQIARHEDQYGYYDVGDPGPSILDSMPEDENWAPLLTGLREAGPDEDALAAMDAEWQTIMDGVKEAALQDKATYPGSTVPPRTPASDYIRPMDVLDDEYIAGDEQEFEPNLFDREKVRDFLNILADGGELPPDPRQEGLVPETFEGFRRRMYKLRDLWETQYLPRKQWKVTPEEMREIEEQEEEFLRDFRQPPDGHDFIGVIPAPRPPPEVEAARKRWDWVLHNLYRSHQSADPLAPLAGLAKAGLLAPNVAYSDPFFDVVGAGPASRIVKAMKRAGIWVELDYITGKMSEHRPMPEWSVVVDVFINLNFPPWYKLYMELHKNPYRPNVTLPNMASLLDLAESGEVVAVDNFHSEAGRFDGPSEGSVTPEGRPWSWTPSGRPVPPEPPRPPGGAPRPSETSPGSAEAADEVVCQDPGIEQLLAWVVDSNRAAVPAECHGFTRTPHEATISTAVLLPGLRAVQSLAAAAITFKDCITVREAHDTMSLAADARSCGTFEVGGFQYTVSFFIHLQKRRRLPPPYAGGEKSEVKAASSGDPTAAAAAKLGFQGTSGSWDWAAEQALLPQYDPLACFGTSYRPSTSRDQSASKMGPHSPAIFPDAKV